MRLLLSKFTFSKILSGTLDLGVPNNLEQTGSEVIKLFSCSTQLSMKFQLLIKTEIPTNENVSCFKSLRCCIYHANKCKNANDCRHFNIYEQDKFHSQLS